MRARSLGTIGRPLCRIEPAIASPLWRPLCTRNSEPDDFVPEVACSADDFGSGRNNIFAENMQPTSPVVHATGDSEEYWRALNVDNQPARKGEAAAVKKKRLAWVARKRGWGECAHFLNAFADSAEWESIDDPESLDQLERLLVCDDMFVMKLVAGTRPAPPELDSPVLATMQKFAKDSPEALRA